MPLSGRFIETYRVDDALPPLVTCLLRLDRKGETQRPSGRSPPGDYKRLFHGDVHCLTELSSASGGSRMAGRPRQPTHTSTSRRRPVTGKKSLAGAVAVVAGATRGAGRGIARALGEAGATVYCTGRSVRDRPSPYNRPETIEETAESINAAGGSAIALQVDHTAEAEVAALFGRVDAEHGQLDVLVNSLAGEDPTFEWRQP